MWQVVLCSSWLLVCPAQIYSSLRAVFRMVWTQLQVSKKICIYRINSGVAPEVMPHCAQKLFYIGVTCVIRKSCVSMAGLRLVMFCTPHHTAACPVVTPPWLICPSVLLLGHAHQMSPFKHLWAAGFCLSYLQTLRVNKAGKYVGHLFAASPVLYPAIILTDDPILSS